MHISILVTDYLTKISIKTVPQPPCSPELAPCDFWLFPKLRGRRYETIEEMKEAVTKVIDTLRQNDFHEAFQKLLERYNKCIAAGGVYFEGDNSFMCVLSIKVPIRKKSWNLFNDPRILYLKYNITVYIYQLWNLVIRKSIHWCLIISVGLKAHFSCPAHYIFHHAMNLFFSHYNFMTIAIDMLTMHYIMGSFDEVEI